MKSQSCITISFFLALNLFIFHARGNSQTIQSDYWLPTCDVVAIYNKDFEKYNFIDNDIKKEMRRYIIPEDHPLKEKLDRIFKSSRVTRDIEAFQDAGFSIISKRPRSFVYVARHPLLKNFVIKAYMDSELREKGGIPGWKWLVQRCLGARKIEYVIAKRRYRYFRVAQKWIYPLPPVPVTPDDGEHVQQLALLVATDMELTSMKENLRAWHDEITKDHLRELYGILKVAKGGSYRPDNIHYTKSGVFAFIDTEYPSNGPDFKSIKKFLSPEMLEYWNELIENGKT